MLLMTYNILMGGHLSGGDRTELLFEVIRRVDPDVLGLSECKGFEEDGSKRLKFFCQELGMEGFMNRAPDGNHLAILYRKGIIPIRSSTMDFGMHHGLIRVAFDCKEVGTITIVHSHLHAFSSWHRIGEAQTIVAKAFQDGEAIIMGDMNAVAKADLPIDLSDVSPVLAARLSAPDNSIDTQTISTILDHGFCDLGAATVGPTYSTAVGEETQTGIPRVRLDYVFVTPRLENYCRSIMAIRDDLTYKASDHLPVVAHFDLTLK